MSLRFDRVYGSVTAQGRPIFGRRKYGVPPGGAFDLSVVALLNQLVGNPADSLCLESAMAAATLDCDSPSVIAWGGAPGDVQANGRSIPPWTSALVLPETRIEVAPPVAGARIWIAIAGGLLTKAGSVLGSGDVIRVGPSSASTVGRTVAAPTWPGGCLPLMISGPEWVDSVKGEFEVLPASDRVGIRLRGSTPPHRLELPSRPAAVGTLQVTPSGDLILLGPDGPSIGGYPQAGTVPSYAVSRLAQLRPGTAVEFEIVTAP